jgi:hypothetical protein
MFDAIAVASGLALDAIPRDAAARVAKAKRDLLEAGYSAEDVPRIAEYLTRSLGWKPGMVNPQTIARESARWRGSLKPAPTRTSSFTPEQEANFLNLPSDEQLAENLRRGEEMRQQRIAQLMGRSS